MKTTKKPATRAKVARKVSRVAEPAAPKPPAPAAPKLPAPTRSEIASRAYELYAKSGHQPGREVEFWLEADRQLQRGRRT